jgi:ATP-dependent helicase HrpB
MVGGRGVELAESSGVRDAELFVALDAEAGRRGLHSVSLVRMASAVTESDLQRLFPEQLEESVETQFDEEAGAVRAVRRRMFAGLTLDERDEPALVDDLEAARLLAAAVRRHGGVVARLDRRARQLAARVRLAIQHLAPDGWPDVSDSGLEALLVADAAWGKRTLDQMSRIDWGSLIDARLSHAQRRMLAQELPERIEVPSGRKVLVDYAAAEGGAGPVMAVKLQELFGLHETPRLARGRLPLILHLLAPNDRPVQVTADLASFWERGYPEVRKQLRGRYPKHPWPEDPLAARPGGPRGRG